MTSDDSTIRRRTWYCIKAYEIGGRPKFALLGDAGLFKGGRESSYTLYIEGGQGQDIILGSRSIRKSTSIKVQEKRALLTDGEDGILTRT